MLSTKFNNETTNNCDDQLCLLKISSDTCENCYRRDIRGLDGKSLLLVDNIAYLCWDRQSLSHNARRPKGSGWPTESGGPPGLAIVPPSTATIGHPVPSSGVVAPTPVKSPDPKSWTPRTGWCSTWVVFGTRPTRCVCTPRLRNDSKHVWNLGRDQQ